MKRRVLTAMVVAMAFLMIATPVFAGGPTNVEGIPWNDDARWHSGQYIGPSIFGIGTETVIELDGLTITVGEIPDAEFDDVTGEWTGTHLMWKARYADPDDACPLWSTYKFWLNGSGTVVITFDYGGSLVTESATEFIFLKATMVGCSFDTFTLQAYK